MISRTSAEATPHPTLPSSPQSSKTTDYHSSWLTQADVAYFESKIPRHSTSSSPTSETWTNVVTTPHMKVSRKKPMHGSKTTCIRGVSRHLNIKPSALFKHLTHPDLMHTWMRNLIRVRSFSPYNAQSDVIYNTYVYPSILSNRESLCVRTRIIDKVNEKYIVMWKSCTHPSIAQSAQYIRTYSYGCYIIEVDPHDSNSSVFYSYCEIDLCGWLPSWFVTKFIPMGIKEMFVKINKCCVSYELESDDRIKTGGGRSKKEAEDDKAAELGGNVCRVCSSGDDDGDSVDSVDDEDYSVKAAKIEKDMYGGAQFNHYMDSDSERDSDGLYMFDAFEEEERSSDDALHTSSHISYTTVNNNNSNAATTNTPASPSRTTSLNKPTKIDERMYEMSAKYNNSTFQSSYSSRNIQSSIDKITSTGHVKGSRRRAIKMFFKRNSFSTSSTASVEDGEHVASLNRNTSSGSNTGSGTSKVDYVAELTKLVDLKVGGFINEEEFGMAKMKLLTN